MTRDLDLLAAVTLDAHLLARHADHRRPLPDGRAWERTVGQLLCRPGLASRQYAGLTTLFGTGAASRCPHELDAVAAGWRGSVLVEAKSKGEGINKGDVAVFAMKTFDYYCGLLPAAADEPWWRLLVSAGPVADNLRRLCLQEGMILCDPRNLPIPMLVAVASKPIADQYLDEVKLAEIVRLAEPVCEPLRERWKLLPDGTLRFRPRRWTHDELDDLLWLQEELSDDVMDLYDVHRPGRLEARIEQLAARLRVSAYA